MTNNFSLGLVIGGAVSSTLGSAFKDVQGRIKHLTEQGTKARVLQGIIGDTQRLQREWKKAHDNGSEAAGALLKQLNTNLDSLKQQGVAVSKLRQEYQALGRVARGMELKAQGHQQIAEGRAGLRNTLGQAAATTAAIALPTKVSADYGAIIRDIAIKGGMAGTAQESQMSQRIVQTSRDTGMARNDVADVVNQLVAGGMALNKALEYAPAAAKFAVGQNSQGSDAAKMIGALKQNARITDPKEMQKALEAIAYQGQAGSFEANDMAKWFPELLANMGNLGIYGMDAVTQLGAMLQVQMKTAGSSDEAANNLKNWMSKIGSGETVDHYAKAGIDYQGSLNTGLAKGLSTLEASFALAQQYIEKTDPEKAKAMAEAADNINKETNPEKAQAMMRALEASLRTGDLFADMQVKSALSAYLQNKELYQQQKRDSKNAAGILDRNLAERRDASAQKWREVGQNMDDALRAMGDAIRPLTDPVAQGLSTIATGLSRLTDEFPQVVIGLTSVAAGVIGLKTVVNSFKIAKGLLNVGRGSLMGNPNVVQRVFVTNGDSAGAGAGPDGGGDRNGRGRGRRWGAAKAGLKGGAPVAVFGAAMQVADTYQNAETQDEKAEGYGHAAGTFAGTLAGAAAGAALGSFVPVIGTAIGAVIGGALGAWGGGELGGMAGKAAFGSNPQAYSGTPLMMKNAAQAPGLSLGDVARSLAPTASSAPAPLMLKPAAPPQPPAPKIEQPMTFAPSLQIEVKGDLKDPQQLANELMPRLQQLMTEFNRQAERRALYDTPHV